MAGWSNEFKVGLLGIVATVLGGGLISRVDDRPRGTADTYTLYAYLDSADGVYPSTQVTVAGVPVGSVRKVVLEQDQALVTLDITSGAVLPLDSTGELRMEGVLGDKVFRILPGVADEPMTDGDVLETRTVGPDIDQLTAKVTKITEDVAAITGTLRTYVEDQGTKDAVDATVQNIRLLTEQIRELTEANRAQVDTIARNLSETSGTLNDVVSRTAASVQDELVAIEEATRKLDSALASIESIAAKVDEGQGTLGRLVNEDETISEIDATITQLQTALTSATSAIDEISGVVGDVTGMKMQVRYNAQLFVGSQPTRGEFPEGNPLHLGMRHILGIRIVPSEERYYLFEVVDHPLGVISYEDHALPDLGSSYREYVRASGLRISFQVARRWNNSVLRFGLKENSGGVGIDQYFFDDRLQLSADLYDAQFGSWPILDNSPNISFGARLEPIEHLWVQAGLENVYFGARYGYVTGYVGAGFHFYDDDLKWVLAALPSF